MWRWDWLLIHVHCWKCSNCLALHRSGLEIRTIKIDENNLFACETSKLPFYLADPCYLLSPPCYFKRIQCYFTKNVLVLQVTNVFLDGHSNPQVKLIGLKMTPVFNDIDVPDFLLGPLRYPSSSLWSDIYGNGLIAFPFCWCA